MKLSVIKRVLFSVVLLIAFFSSYAQESESKRSIEVGIEMQAYPTGIIPGINLEVGISDQDALNLRVGYNLFNHRDLGVQEEETGGGFGFTLGYRHYFKPQVSGLFLGARSDVWFNSVDWTNGIGTPAMASGTSDIVVLQPTLEAGYKMRSKNEHFALAPTLAFGAEINVQSNGEDVGQGAIVLIGVIVDFKLK